MKITDVQAVYPNYEHVVPSWRTNFWQIVVKVQTDLGYVGFGYGGGGIASVAIINQHLKDILTDTVIDTVQDIQKIWDKLYFETLPYGRKGLAIMAISGIDLALYDLLGKSTNQPVFELLGGARKDKIQAYATGQDSELYCDLGFTAHKFPHRWSDDTDYQIAIEKSKRVRSLFGPDARIMIDTYMSCDSIVTETMADLLTDYELFWFEDVMTPDDRSGQHGLRAICNPTLIAGGEHEFTQFGFADLAERESLGLWQPDITWCGGLTAGIRITDMAQELGIPVSPHRGAEVWGLSLIMASSWADFAECHSDHIKSDRDILWVGEPEVKDGFIYPSDSPGFGVSLNDGLL